MKDQDLVNALRSHADWAKENEWDAPITLSNDLETAADAQCRCQTVKEGRNDG